MNDVTHLVHLSPWVGESKKWVTSFMHDTQTTFFYCIVGNYHQCQSMNDVTHVKSKNGWHHSCMTPRLPFLPASLLVSRSRFLTTWLCKDFPWLCYCIVGNCHHFELWTRNFKSRKFKINKNSYFLHWNFDWKSCFVVFFLQWNEWKNPQFIFSSQNLTIECNFSNEIENILNLRIIAGF